MAQQNNPYYVDPGNDYSQGLSGLSNTMLNIRQNQIANAEQQRQQDQYDRALKRTQEIQVAAQEAIASKDPERVAQIAIKYPEVTQMIQQATGLKTDMQKNEASDFLQRLNTAPPDQRDAIYKQRINYLRDNKRDASHTEQSYQDYLENPASEMTHTKMLLSWADPVAYKALVDEQKAAAKALADKQKADFEQQKFDNSNQQFDRAEAGRNQRANMRNSIVARNGAAGQGKPTAHMQDYDRYQELLKNDPEGAKAFGQASGFVSKEGRELSPGVQLRLAKTIDSAVSAENDVNKFNNLADQMEKSSASGGFAGTAAEALKEFTGNQDAVSDLRKSVAAVRASQASGNLPPGAASDADVKIAFGPMPSDNASPAQWARYLRAQANVQQAAAKYHGFKADYISDTGSERGMLQKWKEQGKPGSTNPGSPSAPTNQNSAPPAVTTQAQFDALPSGAVYMEDGQQYRKP